MRVTDGRGEAMYLCTKFHTVKRILRALLLCLPVLFASQAHAQATAKDIDVTTFSKFMKEKKGAQIIDVRTPEETSQGMIAGAREIDINDPAFQKKIAALDKNKPVLVYCRSGGRSGRAMAMMSQMGFKEVYNLSGGILAWQSAKKPVVKK